LVALRSVFESCSITGPHISRKLQIEGMATFALSPGKSPYKIAVYTPGNKVKQSIYTFFLYFFCTKGAHALCKLCSLYSVYQSCLETLP